MILNAIPTQCPICSTDLKSKIINSRTNAIRCREHDIATYNHYRLVITNDKLVRYTIIYNGIILNQDIIKGTYSLDMRTAPIGGFNRWHSMVKNGIVEMDLSNKESIINKMQLLLVFAQ